MNRIFYVMGAVAIGAVLSRPLSSSVSSVPLSTMELTAVHEWLSGNGLEAPLTIALDATAFVAADFEVPDDTLTGDRRALQQFGERRLRAIRDALMPFGFEDYRVDLTTRAPGSGVAKHLGSVRSIDGGPIEWVAP
jgi:hypothetical protein